MHVNVSRVVLLWMVILLSVKTRSQQTDTIIANFDYNRSNINMKADAAMSRYFSDGKTLFVIQNVKLSGYCDNIGTSHYNDSLSLARVKSIKTYLCNKWIDSSVISLEQGFGEKYPLNSNNTEVLRAANRRVKITLQKIRIDPAQQHTAIDTEVKKPIAPQTKAISLHEKIIDTATKAGSSIILENIIFYGGKHIPMAISLPVMDELLQVMQENPLLQIEIGGYVCCEPDDQDGTDSDTGFKDLSLQRAKYIYDFLKKNGIYKGRMRYAGYGASHKLYPEEKNYKEQTLNRRVEIKIISK
jgi:outer membrane protein OmpA-like peptidoglycan-associated protein